MLAFAAGCAALTLTPPPLPSLRPAQGNAVNSNVDNWEKDKIRAAVVVDHNSRPCLK